jgi:hypothetical protein
MATVEDIAKWMFEEVKKKGTLGLEQADAVLRIEKQFGKEFVYDNDNGNRAISRQVLAAFKRLTGGTVIWSRGEKAWRMRGPNDPKGKRQVDW